MRATARRMLSSRPSCRMSTRLASSPEPLCTTDRIDRSSSAKIEAMRASTPGRSATSVRR